MVWYTIVGHIFELPFNYNPVGAKKRASLEEEVTWLRHKNEYFQAALDQIQKKEAENKRLIGIGEKLDKLKTIFQSPCSLKADTLYLHIQVLYPRAKPHSFALVIPISVVAFLVNIGVCEAKDPTNNKTMRAVQNETPTYNTINQIGWRAQQYFYKDVLMGLESGIPLLVAFDKG